MQTTDNANKLPESPGAHVLELDILSEEAAHGCKHFVVGQLSSGTVPASCFSSRGDSSSTIQGRHQSDSQFLPPNPVAATSSALGRV